MLDTRELGRRPGSQRQMTLTVPAPADLGTDVLGVAEGAPVELDLRLEAVMEGVLVTGEAHAELTGECVRCLEPIDDEVDVTFQELFVYDDLRGRDGGRGAHQADDTDDEVRMLDDDLLDLEPLLRDSVVLALPFQPLCSPDCPGLCPDCGARLADDPEHGHDDAIDPRWAALTRLQPSDPPSDQHTG